MTSGITIISAYTRDNGYAQEVARLSASLDALGAAYIVEAYDNRGSWVKNCAYKAAFIYKQRMEIEGPLLWLDADARVVGDPGPHLQCLRCDIACHMLGGKELISSTVYMNDTDACASLLGRWVQMQDQRGDVWDQKVLQSAIQEAGAGVAFENLPPELCWIQAEGGVEDISQRVYGERDPVIIQTQASRRLKH